MDKAVNLIRTPANEVFSCAKEAENMLQTGECDNTKLQQTLELLIASPHGYSYREVAAQIDAYLKTQQAEA